MDVQIPLEGPLVESHFVERPNRFLLHCRVPGEEEVQEVLGVPIPRVTIPLNPGKNITVISEVVAMNHLLKYSGVNSAARFDRKLRQYLEQDYE